MTFTNKLHYTNGVANANALGVDPEHEEMTQFPKVDNKNIIEINAKLEVLEMLGGIIDSLREGLTRQLVVNDIKDNEILENRLNMLEVIQRGVESEDCEKNII